MNSNKIITSGPLIPSVIDTPIDLRTRVNTIEDIYNIELPYIGMIVYVIDEDKYYKVKTLKTKTVGSITIKDSLVDTFEEFLIVGPQGPAGKDGVDADISNLMTKNNPEFTGRLSSISGGIKVGLAAEIDKDNGCIAFGTEAKALNAWTFAFGQAVSATGLNAFGEGFWTEAHGCYSHAENYCTKAKGDASHAEGEETIAAGRGSHVEGKCTVAGINTTYQHVQGKFNTIDTENRYAHIVGNGSGNLPDPDLNRSNAHTLDWNGNAWFAGDVFIKGTNQDDAQKLATEDMVMALQQEIAELRAMIEELKSNPPEEYLPSEISGFKYVIANQNIASEMANMQSYISNEDVVGFIINPLLYKVKKDYDNDDSIDRYYDYFLDFEISLENNLSFNSKNRIQKYKSIIMNIYTSSKDIDFTLDLARFFDDSSYGKITMQLDLDSDKDHIIDADGDSIAYSYSKQILNLYENNKDLLVNLDITLVPYVNYGGELDGYYREIELQKHSTYLNMTIK